jgi:hypothetical protein
MDRDAPVHPERDILSLSGGLPCAITAFMPSRLAQPKLERLSYQPALSLVGLWDSLPTNLGVAVCLQPGTELAFETNVRYRAAWFRSHTVSFNVAKFCKLAPKNPIQHHDALALPDGSTVLVNTLVRGQRVQVLQMPVTESRLRAKEQSPLPQGEKSIFDHGN